MSEIEFVGLFFLVVIPVIASIIALVKTFTTPMIELNTTMVELKESIKSLHSDMSRQDQRLDIHGDRIDSLEHAVTEHGVRISHLEGKVREWLNAEDPMRFWRR